MRCRLRHEWITRTLALLLAAAPQPAVALQRNELPRKRLRAGARERLFSGSSDESIVAAARGARFATRGGNVSLAAVETDLVAAR